MRMRPLVITLWLLDFGNLAAFVPSRRLFFVTTVSLQNNNNNNDNARPITTDDQEDDPLLFLLPFVVSETLLPGTSTRVILKDGKFLEVFEDRVLADGGGGRLAIAVLGQDDLLDTVVVCQVSDYSIDAGFRGRLTISCTLIGQYIARITNMVQMKPVILAHVSCRSFLQQDEPASDTDAALVEDIERTVAALGRTDELETIIISLTGYSRASAVSWAIFGLMEYRSEDLFKWTLSERLQRGLRLLLRRQFMLTSADSATAITTMDESSSSSSSLLSDGSFE